MTEPLVSVVTPAFNAEDTIQKTLRSVKSQTYKNIEHIVINDGSTDQTLERVQRFSSASLKCITNGENLGRSSSRNIGIEVSLGEFILFLDSDDTIDIDYVQYMVQAYRVLRVKEETRKIILICGWREYDPIKRTSQEVLHRRIYSYEDFTENCPFIIHSCMIPREVIEGRYFPTEYDYAEDWRLWKAISESGYVYYPVPVALCVYNKTVKNISVEKACSNYKSVLGLVFDETTVDAGSPKKSGGGRLKFLFWFMGLEASRGDKYAWIDKEFSHIKVCGEELKELSLLGFYQHGMSFSRTAAVHSSTKHERLVELYRSADLEQYLEHCFPDASRNTQEHRGVQSITLNRSTSAVASANFHLEVLTRFGKFYLPVSLVIDRISDSKIVFQYLVGSIRFASLVFANVRSIVCGTSILSTGIASKKNLLKNIFSLWVLCVIKIDDIPVSKIFNGNSLYFNRRILKPCLRTVDVSSETVRNILDVFFTFDKKCVVVNIDLSSLCRAVSAECSEVTITAIISELENTINNLDRKVIDVVSFGSLGSGNDTLSDREVRQKCILKIENIPSFALSCVTNYLTTNNLSAVIILDLSQLSHFQALRFAAPGVTAQANSIHYGVKFKARNQIGKNYNCYLRRFVSEISESKIELLVQIEEHNVSKEFLDVFFFLGCSQCFIKNVGLVSWYDTKATIPELDSQLFTAI